MKETHEIGERGRAQRSVQDVAQQAQQASVAVRAMHSGQFCILLAALRWVGVPVALSLKPQPAAPPGG